MIQSMRVLLTLAATLFLATTGQAASPKAPELKVNSDLTFFLAPNGDDGRSGATPAEAVRTLGRVQELLKARTLKDTDRQIAVKFVPGRYSGLEVTWDYVAPGRTILFEPQNYQRGKSSVFIEGQNGDVEQFFLLRVMTPTTGDETINTGLVFRGLDISNYCEGISLGDWKSKANVSGNVIEDNRLTRIGSKYQTPKVQDDGRRLPTGACVAAVRLQHASGNIVRANVFQDIENLPSSRTGAAKYGPLLLHSIYISKNSSDNLIEGNRFERFSGSPVRIRAQSDNNIIVNNTFDAPTFPGKVPPGYRIKAVSQWYCNDAVKICKERAEDGNTECPSTGTEIVGNRVARSLDLYADESQSKTATCTVRSRSTAASIEPRLERNSQR